MSLNEYICPTCGMKMPRDVDLIKVHTEKDIIELIKKKHPRWVEGNGVCKKCDAYYRNKLHPK